MTAPDPGLQPERTLLAWRRTALGLVANGVLLLASGVGTSGVRVGLGVTVTVLALSCWAVVGAVYRRLARGGAPPAGLGSDRLLRVATGLVLMVGLFDLYAVVTR
jgi:uncharacterized membrane protein YidH (DUF202 family)